MRNSILILVAVLTLAFTGCSKSKTEPEKPKQTIPVFDLRTETLSQWDKQQSNTFMTLWQFKYFKQNDEDAKMVGFSRNESGKPYNVLENSVGREDIFVYFQFHLNFEVANRDVAEKLRQAVGNNGIVKQAVWAGVKNVARKGFNKERDLKDLNNVITNSILTNLRQIFKSELSAGLIHFRDDYTKNPLQIVPRNFKK
ncbi:hypothetical protein RCZ02_16560 [Capnocytophaga felis]|uniref:hypothetical protein n=1 Tax=Capnocytophaga felis TaxID=2267611 RepID=UPI0012CD78B1|nr:hypothetical protein [Capnocytophaga felis]GET48825.1 hypothetical protein RCZ02_16560 [Capnocytophaga felis]